MYFVSNSISKTAHPLFIAASFLVLLNCGNINAQWNTQQSRVNRQQLQPQSPTIEPAHYNQTLSQNIESQVNTQHRNQEPLPTNSYNRPQGPVMFPSTDIYMTTNHYYSQNPFSQQNPLNSVQPVSAQRQPVQNAPIASQNFGASASTRPPVQNAPIASVASQRLPEPPAPGLQYENTVIRQQLNDISYSNEMLAKQLFKILVDEAQGHDLIFSPFSIWSLLLTISEGAQFQTLNQLLNLLNINDISRVSDAFDQIYKGLVIEGGKQQTVELKVFQAMFYNRSQQVNPEYEQLIRNKYHAETYSFDGNNPEQQLREVNQKVRERSGGQIQAAFNRKDLTGASLLLLSLINFRGQWSQPFNRSFTKQEPFYDESGVETGRVQMMFQRAVVPYAPIKELQSHVIELPYGDMKRLSMLVILPRKDVLLSEVVDKLQNVRLRDVMSILSKAIEDFEDDEIEIYLPQFNTTTDISLNQVLQSLGVQKIFSTEAEMDKINPNIYLSKMIHKAKIQVDEEGTVASGITAGVFANKSSAPRFYANRPFLYLIVDRVSELILFCGQLKNKPQLPRQRSIRN